MNVVAVIPARMAATRFPRKPMATIHGMPMIGHCFHRTAIAFGIENVLVATCDKEIAEYVDSIGGQFVMTSDQHTRATTRTAEAIEKIEISRNESIDVVVMVQGDEPMVEPNALTDLLKSFEDPSVKIANIMCRFDTKDAFEDKNNVKVVVKTNNDALYFSREGIPSSWNGWCKSHAYMQTGIIAFRNEELSKFNFADETALERIESIDMNRVLELGDNIRMILSDTVTIGVDTQEELLLAETILAKDGVMKEYLNK